MCIPTIDRDCGVVREEVTNRIARAVVNAFYRCNPWLLFFFSSILDNCFPFYSYWIKSNVFIPH